MYEKVKDKLRLQSILVEEKEKGKAQEFDQTMVKSLSKVFHETGFVEVIEQMGQAYNQVLTEIKELREESSAQSSQIKELQEQLQQERQLLAAEREKEIADRDKRLLEMLWDIQEVKRL
jgi:hypothetical protein